MPTPRTGFYANPLTLDAIENITSIASCSKDPQAVIAEPFGDNPTTSQLLSEGYVIRGGLDFGSGLRQTPTRDNCIFVQVDDSETWQPARFVYSDDKALLIRTYSVQVQVTARPAQASSIARVLLVFADGSEVEYTGDEIKTVEQRGPNARTLNKTAPVETESE